MNIDEKLKREKLIWKKAAMLSQESMMKIIRDETGLNLVRCYECEEVFLHWMAFSHTSCPHCQAISDTSDFPDVIYDGKHKEVKL